MHQSGLMIAAPQSGSGKTVVTLALLAALRARGIDIRAAKAGPDYIDPAFHEFASGHPSVNLDPWAMSALRVQQLAAAQGGSYLLVEAMMGLFDGAGDGSGSAGDLAASLGLPVVLVIDASKQSHSVAALARGFPRPSQDVEIAGVILNRVAGGHHEKMLRDALESVGIPVFGAVSRDERLQLPERHLGLVQAGEHRRLDEFISVAAEIIGRSVDVDALMARFAPLPAPVSSGHPRRCAAGPAHRDRPRQCVFIPLSALAGRLAQRRGGASFFSPLADEAPPEDADAIFLPGGYPELHGGQLAARIASAPACVTR